MNREIGRRALLLAMAQKLGNAKQGEVHTALYEERHEWSELCKLAALPTNIEKANSQKMLDMLTLFVYV